MLDQLSPPEVLDALAHFSAGALRRARSYANDDTIALLDPRALRSDDEAVAIVRGTLPYQTVLQWRGDRLMGSCTCPVGTNCKHAAALAMYLAGTSRPQLTKGQRAARDVGHWLTDVGHDLDAAPRSGDSDWLVAYTLVLRTTYESPYIQVGRTRVGKTGRLNKPTNLGSVGGRGGLLLPEWVPDEQESLIAQLVGPSEQRYAGQLRCEIENVDLGTIERLAATGRFFIDSHKNPPVQFDEPRAIRLELRRSKEGDGFVLAPALSPGVVLVEARRWIFIASATSSIGAADFGIANALVRRLLRGPVLPAETVPTVQRSLRDVLGYDVEFRAGDAPRRNKREPAPPPLVPILDVSTRRDPQTGRDELLIKPVAGYGDARYDAASSYQPGDVARDLVGEEKRWAQLYDESAITREGAWDEDDDDVRDSLQELATRLAAHGWQLEGNVDVSAPDIDFVSHVGGVDGASGGVWFTYELGVVVDGETTPLLPLLLQALRQGALDLRHLDRPLRLTLPDGRRVQVPAEQLARWVRPLLELQLRGLDDDGTLQLPASSLLDSDDGSDDDGNSSQFADAASLAAVRQRLAGLLDVQPRPAGPDFDGSLRPYQQVGHAWLRRLHDDGLGGLLADDMGLGKTVQLLAFIDGLRADGGVSTRGRALVIAPRSVVDNWASEARRFAPGLVSRVHLGPDRARSIKALGKTTLVLTSYQTLLRDIAWLGKHTWATVVLDEAQAVKTPGTKIRKAVKQLDASSRFCVTGTPIENNLLELWSQLDIAMPGLLGQRKAFSTAFRTPIEKQHDRQRLDLLRRRIRPFMLRRRKADVDIDLPPKTDVVERVELVGGQRDLYESLRLVFDKNVRDAMTARGKGRSSMVILDALLRLRQSCCDPRLVKLPQAQAVDDSAKLARLGEILGQLQTEGRRTLVFSQFTSMLSLIEAECTRRGIDYVKLTGRTRKRDQVIRAFQDGDAPVFLISLKAGGTGLNLTAADTVIHYDPWWNPAVQAQATDRAHRIGQTKPVIVYRLVAAGTVEDRILELQKTKQDLSDAALEQGGLSHFTADDIQALLAPIE